MTDDYVIWSHEHGAWWAAPTGYTSQLQRARRFSAATALATCLNAIPGTAARIGALPDLPVRLADVQALVSAYTARFDGRVESWM